MKKIIRSWVLFDWAAQPFHTVIVTFIFAPYFQDIIVGDAVKGQSLIGLMATIAALAVAICAPISTAISDQSGGRKKWIFVLSIAYFFFCFGLYFESSLYWVMMCYILAYFFVEMLLVFVSAYLPEITNKENVGELSNKAWGIGYLGGLSVLFIYLLFLMPAPGKTTTLIGVTPMFPENYGATTGPVSAIWYAIFMIPFFINMPETKAKGDVKGAFSRSLKSLRHSFTVAWKDQPLRWFYLSSLLSRDALAGVFFFGSLYANAVLEWTLFNLAIYGIILNITGALGGWYGGVLDRRKGGEFVTKISIYALAIVTFAALTSNLNHAILIPVAEGSQLPHIIFFICGMIIGAAAGSLQGSMRGLVGPLTYGKIPTGEAFGLYGMLGRATAFISPMLVGIFTQITQSAQYGAWPIIGLFVLALLVFRQFEKAKGGAR